MVGPPDCSLMPINVTWKYVGMDFEFGSPTIGQPKEMQGTWRGHGYFFRLWVGNRGHYAERVQVYVESIDMFSDDGLRQEPLADFIPMNLRWTDSPGDSPLIFEAINPKMGRYCDFGGVCQPGNPMEIARDGMKKGDSTFNLHTQVSPSTGCNRLRPGKYRIHLLLAASNSRPKHYTVSLEWSGSYSNDEKQMFDNEAKLYLTD